MILRWGGTLIALVAVIAACGVVFVKQSELAVDQWHKDPATVERTGRPNDYLVAPEGTTVVPPDRVAEVFSEPADDLLARFAEVALVEPRVVEIGDGGGGYRTFVQRSALIGFPDYVSVRAVDVEGGAGLIVYSRSQYGYSDWGVNTARVEDWLSKL